MFIQEKRDKKFITEALKIAEDVEKFGNSRHAALLVYKNSVVSYGTNYNPKTHPLAKIFGKNKHAIFPHAELSVIISAKKRGFNDWERSTLYIARVIQDKKVFIPALSAPCEGCWKAIEHYNIKRLCWTVNSEKIVVAHINGNSEV